MSLLPARPVGSSLPPPRSRQARLLLWLLSVSVCMAQSPSSGAAPIDCGDGVCFHGGTCVTKTTTSGALRYECDCRATVSATTAYAGRYCQYPATVFCPTNDNNSESLFCVNGGTCNSNPYRGCVCSPPYTGFACEFKIPEAQQSGNVDGNYDTVQKSIVYTEAPVPTDPPQQPLPDPVDLTQGTEAEEEDDAAEDDQFEPTGEEETGFVDSLVEQETRSNGGGTSQEPPTNSQTDGGFVGNKVVYNQHDDDQVAGMMETTMPPMNDIDICTSDGSTLDATPLSFCVNGGTCASRVTSLQGHAGCNCPAEYTGPHCELSVAVLEGVDRSSRSSDSMGTTTTSSSPTGGMGKSLGMVVIVMAALAIAAVTGLATVMYCRSRQRRVARARQNHKLRWGGGYTDNANSEDINLAPRKSFYEADYPVSSHSISSSRDPMAQLGHSHGAAAAASATRQGGGVEEPNGHGQVDLEPHIYIGPPRDEDGHVLHSVEIL